MGNHRDITPTQQGTLWMQLQAGIPRAMELRGCSGVTGSSCTWQGHTAAPAPHSLCSAASSSQQCHPTMALTARSLLGNPICSCEPALQCTALGAPHLRSQPWLPLLKVHTTPYTQPLIQGSSNSLSVITHLQALKILQDRATTPGQLDKKQHKRYGDAGNHKAAPEHKNKAYICNG